MFAGSLITRLTRMKRCECDSSASHYALEMCYIADGVLIQLTNIADTVLTKIRFDCPRPTVSLHVLLTGLLQRCVSRSRRNGYNLHFELLLFCLRSLYKAEKLWVRKSN